MVQRKAMYIFKVVYDLEIVKTFQSILLPCFEKAIFCKGSFGFFWFIFIALQGTKCFNLYLPIFTNVYQFIIFIYQPHLKIYYI